MYGVSSTLHFFKTEKYNVNVVLCIMFVLCMFNKRFPLTISAPKKAKNVCIFSKKKIKKKIRKNITK